MKIEHVVFAAVVLISACASDGSQIVTSQPPPEVAAIAQQLTEVGRDAEASQDASERRRCFRFHWVIKDERASFVPGDDVDLIDALVPHHEMALMMADMEIADGTVPEVVALAERMRAVQMQEIEALKMMREEITGCPYIPPLNEPHHPIDMAALEEADGVEVDRAFLEHMIPHHASAIAFSHNALPNLTHPDLLEMAMNVVEAQSAEICEMRELKAGL
jgi:uncharacterized protein (DUF305 family)